MNFHVWSFPARSSFPSPYEFSDVTKGIHYVTQQSSVIIGFSYPFVVPTHPSTPITASHRLPSKCTDQVFASLKQQLHRSFWVPTETVYFHLPHQSVFWLHRYNEVPKHRRVPSGLVWSECRVRRARTSDNLNRKCMSFQFANLRATSH